MDHFREIKNNLAWHNEGKFEVELINGVITKLNFCEPGKGPDESGKCLTSTNFKFLQSVYYSLGDLFNFIEEENKRLGYSFSRVEESRPTYQQERSEETYPALSDIKIRPLINYSNQIDQSGPSIDEGNLMRDIG
ncbi:hypothetical protein JN11_04820 [Mucilaginibacter frigoritolerans]|jgi:hypothetical protein|uniref:Uncharacterized protein n=1 Tax=Mucilaginibacter frigoritolerans TaxID=652788 RepID=A0A562TLP2_9SPHI|nr:hypothetical protein [Mucilaginibacter frigoritolerans]TWI94214.1 hypothetical protein JN11_04820 [Mucilaginibacter frigoritolerans]